MSTINEFISKCKCPKLDNFEQKLSNFVSYFKGINGYNKYSLEELEKAYKECVKNQYSYYTYSPIYETIGTHELLDLINRIHYHIELHIFTPDHKYCPRHTYSCDIEEADNDMFHVEVYSSKGLIKSYDMSAIGITFEDMYEIIDKERNGYRSGQL